MAVDDTIILAAVIEAGRKTAELIEFQAELEAQLPENERIPASDEPLTGPVLNVISEVVRGIRDGTPLTHVYPEISRLTNNQESRAELIDQLMMSHDYTRYVDFARARDQLDRDLLTAVRNKNLTAIEQVVLHREISKIINQIEGRIRGGAASVKDLTSLLAKVDYAVNTSSQLELQKRFENTTPQAREIARKLLTSLRKAVVQSVANDNADST